MLNRSDILNAYKSHVNSFTTVEESVWKLIEGVANIHQMKKGELLLSEGKVCNYIDFIYSGSLRAFTNKDGFEVTTALYLENTCVTNMRSLTTQLPSTLSLQAVEDVVCARIYNQDLKQLYDQSTGLQQLGRAILEAMLVEENDWKEMYTLYDPEERYLFLIKKAPAMINHFPLQYIASFLGIRRETLSRIRNRTARSK